jgi:hypothetical protein
MLKNHNIFIGIHTHTWVELKISFTVIGSRGINKLHFVNIYFTVIWQFVVSYNLGINKISQLLKYMFSLQKLN